MILLSLIIWGVTIKLWEAPLSNNALLDTALDETCSYNNLKAEGTNISGVGTFDKNAEKICLDFYATVVA